MTLGIVQFLKIQDVDGNVLHQWQNQWANQVVDGHKFFPFATGSLMSKVTSGAVTVTLEFPVDKLTLPLVHDGLRLFYVARVDQYEFIPPVSGLPASKTLTASFTGEFISASISDIAVECRIGSNLDSTESQAPPRRFTTELAGTPPKL